MKFFKLKTLSGLLLAGSAVFAGSASAATLEFTTITGTFGHANEINNGAFNGGCQFNNCYVEDGVVVGVVADPLDSGSHLHRRVVSGEVKAEYEADSTGMYVRNADLSKFSLQNVDITVVGATGGNFVLYGYENALNPGLLTNNVGTPFPDGQANPTDPEGGTVPYIARYQLPNQVASNGTLTLAELLAVDQDWGSIGALWVTFEGFNHSPTNSYELGSVPGYVIHFDNMNIGAPVAAPIPVPGAVWLFGSALVGFISRNRKKASV